MKIKESVFVSSVTDWRKCPKPDKPEYAFIGRSNVGKSSLINSLLEKKGLARVSANPGKTQTINHYLVNNAWYIADLPGYGFAFVSKKKREEFIQFTKAFLKNRVNLMSMFILVDIRVPVQQSDLEFVNWAGIEGIPFSILFTKCDKASNHQMAQRQKEWQKALAPYWDQFPDFFFTSSESGMGKELLLQYVERINSRFIQHTL